MFNSKTMNQQTQTKMIHFSSFKKCKKRFYRRLKNVSEIQVLHLRVQKGQALIDVLDLVHAHFSGVRFAQFFTGNDLQESHQVLSVGQVHEEIVDL